MKQDQNNTRIKVTEDGQNNNTGDRKLTIDKLKKPFIYLLMVIACAGFLFLVFKPEKENDNAEKAGFNSVIPQASDGQLQSDKQKAYEQQLLEQKNEEKKNALTTLSDYWTNAYSETLPPDPISLQSESESALSARNSMNSYQNTRQALGSFYSRDDQEVQHLKKEIHRLRTEAAERESIPATTSINNQLELMEKSYQMAAKYFPTSKPGVSENRSEIKEISASAQTSITIAKPVIHPIVSSLYRSTSDSITFSRLLPQRFRGIEERQFQESQPRNSIRAVIPETKTVTSESVIPVRILESILLGQIKIPSGTFLKAKCRFQGGRLQLHISTIEHGGMIEPVNIDIHDNDGQLGLHIPYSSEQSALSEMAANMGQNSGTSIMMTQSAGQQIAADMSKGVVHGIAGYFQKKVRNQKVTVKTGHLVFLVPKNN
ncbi:MULTISPECIES: conjugative transposon protein TraM [Chryseobacterium]|uniref:conjugative transposon protein TraM n=1 Tax=Chryseobacterium TaxID=59732 RepID=UPI000E753586|nr:MULTISPECIES: conjugative transposon protein TraM [Chryseobacterium]RKE81704.1 conjugative transposon TraM protein [Chryseobacterium sp. AG363]